MLEEYLSNEDGLVISNSTWNYKIPTLDTIPKEFNVEVLNSGHNQNRILSSKGNCLLVCVTKFSFTRIALIIG